MYIHIYINTYEYLMYIHPDAHLHMYKHIHIFWGVEIYIHTSRCVTHLTCLWVSMVVAHVIESFVCEYECDMTHWCVYQNSCICVT